MATQYDTTIQQLYVAYFNRPADAAGLAHWADAMSKGVTAAQISAAFAGSLEYQVEYSQINNAGIVNQVYQNLFGRTAEATGLAFWVKALTDKTMTVANMVDLISKGAQGSDKVAFDSKVVVATAFTAALDTDAEKTGYSGADANKAAKALLATIKTAPQATAAIEKAALDASVAAVIKAATPFTLQAGLASLTAANAAVEAFLEDFAEDNDLEVATGEDITDAVEAAQGDLVSLIEDEDFADASEGVQAALIADQEELNGKALTEANKSLKTASDAVAKVTGLANAIAATTSANAGVKAAQEEALDAQGAYNDAQTVFNGRNPTVTSGTVGGKTVLTDAGKVIATQAADGTWTIATGVTTSNYPGLTNFITAANNLVGAMEEVNAAQEAAILAQLRVEVLDPESATVLNGAFTFEITKPVAANKPTYNEIVNELSALTAASVTADAAVAAAVPQSGAAYDALVLAANDAKADLSAFSEQITDFIEANDTKLADAVALAEEGTLGQAKAAVAEVDGLAAAIAATTPTPEQQDLLADNATVVTAFKNAEAAATGTDMVARVKALGTEGAQAAIDALAEAREALEDAQAVAKEYAALEKAVDTVQADFVAAKFAEPVMLGVSGFGTTDSDIFVATEVNSTVTSFGRSGADVLYVGAGYSLNEGKLADGNDAALEVFFTQKGNNAVITVESKVYGSDSGDVHTITLVGVDIADLNFENGIITL